MLLFPFVMILGLVREKVCCSDTYTFVQKTTTCIRKKGPGGGTQSVQSESPPPPPPSCPSNDGSGMSAMTRHSFCISDDAQVPGPSQPSQCQWECSTHHVAVTVDEGPLDDMSPAQPYTKTWDGVPSTPGQLIPA
jgi:hypothetical protein